MNFQSYQQRAKLIKRIIFWSVIFGGLLALLLSRTSVETFAQPVNVCDQLGGCVRGTENVRSGQEGITAVVRDVVFFFIYIAAAISVAFIVWGGYLMITSAGQSEQYENGLKAFRNAVIGLILAIVSLTIVSLVSGILTGLTVPIIPGRS